MEHFEHSPSWRKVFNYQQEHPFPASRVFPLLCPERQKEWLDGWDYEMIYSKSGLIEKDCVFVTPHSGNGIDTWTVTAYSIPERFIEYVSFCKGEYVLKIQIQVEASSEKRAISYISYTFTSLNEKRAEIVDTFYEEFFQKSMKKWEKSINYYLANNQVLRRNAMLAVEK